MKERIYKTPVQFISNFLIIGAFFMMLSWWVNSTPDSAVSLKMNTAFCFLLVGLHLALRTFDKSRKLSIIPVLFCLLISSLSLAENIFNADYGIDTFLFFDDAVSAFHLMSAGTAFCFFITSISSIIFHFFRNSTSIKNIFYIAYLLVGSIAFISITSHLFTISMEKQPLFFSTMSPITAIFFLLAITGYLLHETDFGLTGIILGKQLGSKIARKLFLIFIPLSLLIGFSFIYALNSNYFSVEFEVVMLTSIMVIISASFIISIALVLNKIDLKRDQVESELNYVNLNLEDMIEEATTELSTKNIEFEAIKNSLEESSLVSITDKYGKILEVNDLFSEVSQYSKDELVGSNHRIINSGYHNKEFWTAMWETITAGKIWKGEVKNKAKDGSYYWVYTVISPIKNKSGEIEKYMSIRQDITENKLSEESLIKATEILNTAQKIGKLGGWELDITTGLTEWTEEVYNIHEVDKDYDHNKEIALNFYHPEYRPVITRAIEECMFFKKPFDVECKFITAKNNIRWVRSSGAAVVENDVVVKLRGVFQDITEQKNNETELNLLNHSVKLATKAANVGIWQYDIIENKLYWDEMMYKLYGKVKDAKTEVYQTWLNSLHPDDKKRCNQEIDLAIHENKEFNTEFRILRNDNEVRYIKGLANVIRNEKGVAEKMVGTNWDITEAVNLQKNLESEKLKAEHASNAKSEFLANMSHEIRTPLNGVIGFSDLLLRTSMNGMQKDYLQSIHLSAKSLLDVINDILDFSKIEAGKLDLHIEKFDLHELIAGLGEMLKYQVKNKDVELLLNISPETVPQYIYADEIRLKQVLLNLLSNAIKFTKQGEIELKITYEKNNVFKFSVRDTGIGISNINKQQIFDAFSQADGGTNRKFGGTGLGLTISNRLLQLMESQLELTSRIAVGSEFNFSCEFKNEFGPLNDDKKFLHIDNVLVVDDNISLQKIMGDFLESYGIAVTQAHSGEEAIEILKSNTGFDLIFMDYHMPGLDGIETTEYLKDNKVIDFKNTPVVLFHSVVSNNELEKRIEKSQIKFQLSKPMDSVKLNECLTACGSKKRHKIAEKIIEKATNNGSFKGITVLLVEDNPVNMKLAKIMLQNILPQSTIIEAMNGQEALDLYNSKEFNLIISDVQMPKMNGYELATAIRSTKKGEGVPIIALTAATVKGEKERCLEAGMSSYVSKPIIEEDLKTAIAQWLPIQKKSLTKLDKNHFDYDLLYSTINDTELINELMTELKPELNKTYNEMADAFNRQNYGEVKHAAHRMKGTAMSLHLNKLRKLAERIENIDSDDAEVNDYSIKALKQEMDFLIENIYIKDIT